MPSSRSLAPVQPTTMGGGPTRWTRGTVYDSAGKLIRDSQRIGGLGGDLVLATDPLRLTQSETRRKRRRLHGTWLYVGSWVNHFGHFITENLTTLRPESLELDGVVAHPFVFGGPEPDWQLRLLEMCG
jgi:hypothetical protein